MRVAVVALQTSHYRDTPGRRRVERVAHTLADAGHEVACFCSQWWGGYATEHEADGVTYRGVTSSPTVPSFRTRLPPMLARYRPDVVYTIPEPPAVVLAARTGSRLARAPVVVDWYGDESVDGSRKSRRALRTAACHVAPSELVRTRLREFGAPGESTTVIPESIDMDLVRAAEPAEAVDVAYAHPLDETANVNALFLGLAELRQRDWSATVIGDGPEREAYEQEAADLRIDDRVEFVGACDREQRVSIYKGAHVFVQTAFEQHFATDLLWALACGCLGIVEYQADSSAHELVERRERGFRVTTPQEIGDCIVAAADYERLTVDESWAEYDHAAVAEQYASLFERHADGYGLF